MNMLSSLSVMANLLPVMFSLVIFILLVTTISQEMDSSNIILGSSINSNIPPTSWLSPSGLFAFGFYSEGDGFAVGIWLVSQEENTVVWTANRDDQPVSSNSSLELTTDGKLLLRTGEVEKPVIDIMVSAASASMFDSGNFVLFDNKTSVIWESFDFPTDSILGGQNLSSDRELLSGVSKSDHSSGLFSLLMQTDSYLVSYPKTRFTNSSRDAYWSVTPSLNARYLNLDNRGILSITNGSERQIFANSPSPSSNRTMYRATLDADGIFKLYSHHFDNKTGPTMVTEWSSLKDPCQVFGICGLNSYCSSMGGETNCTCYPGFVFKNLIDKKQGCYKNSSVDHCEDGTRVEIISIKDMSWGNDPYLVEVMEKETCAISCFEDCNCGAVRYTIANCAKYNFPLRYGRIIPNSSATVLFAGNLKESHIPPSKPLVVTESSTLLFILAIIIGSLACFCLLIAFASFFMYRRRRRIYRQLSKNEDLGLTRELTPRSFSYSELEKATDGFKEELGRGVNGRFYKGILKNDNKTVAVKKLGKVAEEILREFQAEMTVIGRIHHRNLVRLLGFCIHGYNRLIVYEYMNNGSLSDYLFKAEKRPVWKERVRIGLEVARGIFYMHEECEVKIIHCNIKPQNILMDDSWTAKISDFGVAKLLLQNQMGALAGTGFKGTPAGGYVAPEWQKNGSLITVKADVYSFGVVLLEIVCCRSMIEVDVAEADEIILSSWVNKCFFSGQLNKLVDDETVHMKTLERLVKVGLWCIQDDPDLRPSMKNVILMMEGTMDTPLLPIPADLSFVLS